MARSPRARRTGIAAIVFLLLVGGFFLLTDRDDGAAVPGTDDTPTVPVPADVLEPQTQAPADADRGDAKGTPGAAKAVATDRGANGAGADADRGSADGRADVAEAVVVDGTGADADHGIADGKADAAKAVVEDGAADDGTDRATAAPALDVIRIDGRGGATVAGRAIAGADVVLRIDGQEIARARADAAGNFVSLFDVAAAEAPRLLTIEARDAAGDVTPARDAIIVAPVPPDRTDTAPGPAAGVADPAAVRVRTVEGAIASDPGGAVAIQGAKVVAPPAPKAAGGRRGVDAIPPRAGGPVPVAPDAAMAALSDAAAPRADQPVDAGIRPEPPKARGPASPPVPGSPSAAPATGGAEALAAGGQGDPSPGAPAPAAAPTPRDAPPRGIALASAGPSAPTAFESPGPIVAAVTERERTAAVPPAAGPAVSAATDRRERVPAPPRLFRAGPDGVRPLPGGSVRPDVTETLGIDAISYGARGEVQLAGRAGPDAALRIYLDGQPVQTAQVGPDGTWTSPLPDVRTGVYTLRIDAVGPDGAVTARVETPFQRTAPEVAAAARRDGVAAITVQPGFTLWAISQGYFGEGVRYVQIFEANRDQIRDPNLIYPGQVFALPGGATVTR